MKRTILLLSAALAAGCTLGYNPSYRFNEVQVVNLSGGSIENVSWRVLGSDKSLQCSQVAKFAMCADYFPGRRYPQSGIEVDWTHPDGERKSALLNPDIPVTFPNAFPLRIVMEIDADGGVKGFYEQDEPSRDGGGVFING
ncbi:MAG TPA: hypothetical protein VKB27_11775 [Gammaproteobacteria bacterium]|nr:hypothetical protein [Gammaproteobacteria bacterium]